MLAFEKARAKFNIPGIKIVLITKEYYDLALKFAREHFITHEPSHKALGVTWSQEVKTFWMKLFEYNLSLMFISKENGEPMALQTIIVARYDDNINFEAIQTLPFKELIRCCIHCDEQADFFGYFGITETFHLLGLAVADEYKRRGLATQIVRTAIQMIRNFRIDPTYVKVEGSSNFSQRIFENANFEVLFELQFATWEVDGKCPIQNTGIHKSVRVYGKKLTSELW